ncbi:hypothetical protein AB0H83_39435 [Dactylosporangium sp. NPDC050688]|uniref:hypothetical protein n=1 Tax=Dactylosporangium sp. NPDC050688 TaxID=3157217 RepID=UPI0033D8AE2F
MQRPVERRAGRRGGQVRSGRPAMRSLREEGRRSLETFASLRRVFATATAP